MENNEKTTQNTTNEQEQEFVPKDQPESETISPEIEQKVESDKKLGKLAIKALGLLVIAGTMYGVFETFDNNETPNNQAYEQELKDTTPWQMTVDNHRNGNFISDGMSEIKNPNYNTDPAKLLDSVVDKISKDPFTLAAYGNFFNTFTNRESNLKPNEMISNGQSTEKAIETKEFINDLFDNKVKGYEITSVKYGVIPENATTTYFDEKTGKVGGIKIEKDKRNGLKIVFKKPDGSIEEVYIQGECLNIVPEKVNNYAKVIKITMEIPTPPVIIRPKNPEKDVLKNVKVAPYKKNIPIESDKEKVSYENGNKVANGLQINPEAAAIQAKIEADKIQENNKAIADKARIEAENNAKIEAEKYKAQQLAAQSSNQNTKIESAPVVAPVVESQNNTALSSGPNW